MAILFYKAEFQLIYSTNLWTQVFHNFWIIILGTRFS